MRYPYSIIGAAGILVTVLALSFAPGVSAAPGPTLKVGDPAPRLQVGRWLQGQPVTGFEKGKCYLLEFWATWCGPCVEAIPHIDAIHRKFADKGLVVIGQNVREDDEQVVERFLKRMANKMTFRVALDDRKASEGGAMAVHWLDAAEASGIPTTFLVDGQGLVSWIGHPLELDDALIEMVMAGKRDLAEEGRKQLQKAQAEEALDRAIQAKDWKAAHAGLDELEKLTTGKMRDLFSTSRLFILVASRDMAGARKYAEDFVRRHKDDAESQAVLASAVLAADEASISDFALAETIARGADKAGGGTNSAAVYALGSALLLQGKEPSANQAFVKYVTLAGDDNDAVKEAKESVEMARFDALVRKGDADGAHHFATQFSESVDVKGTYSTQLAQRLLRDPRIQKRDLIAIEKIARRAVDAHEGKVAYSLKPLARVQFMQGRRDEAIATQEKIVQLLKDSPQQRKSAEKALEAYRAGQLPTDE